MASTKPNRWLQASIILLVVGCGFMVITQVFYVPRYRAFVEAFRRFGESHAIGSPPTLEAYGLDVVSLYVGGILGYLGFVMVFIGAAYLIIVFIGKIIRRLGAPI